jgi:hypothetical protein
MDGLPAWLSLCQVVEILTRLLIVLDRRLQVAVVLIWA